MIYEGKLRVLPRGVAMVPHYEVQGSIRRFHGWKHDVQLGEEHDLMDPQTMSPVKRRPGGFRKMAANSSDHVIELPVTPEYIRHVREGDLWPADEATASLCGRPFDPAFGGEHTLLSEVELLEIKAKAADDAAKASQAEADARAKANEELHRAAKEAAEALAKAKSGAKPADVGGAQ